MQALIYYFAPKYMYNYDTIINDDMLPMWLIKRCKLKYRKIGKQNYW